MKITKVAFEKTIGMPNYSNDKPIVIECILEDGETKEQAWSKINQDMIDWHKQEYPALYEALFLETPAGFIPSNHPEKLGEAIINLQHEKLSIAIENAQSLEELAALKPNITEKHLRLYKERLKQLKK